MTLSVCESLEVTALSTVEFSAGAIIVLLAHHCFVIRPRLGTWGGTSRSFSIMQDLCRGHSKTLLAD